MVLNGQHCAQFVGATVGGSCRNHLIKWSTLGWATGMLEIWFLNLILKWHVRCDPCRKIEVHIACKISWHTFFCNVSLHGLYGIYPIKIKHLVSIFLWMAQKSFWDICQTEIEWKRSWIEPLWRDFWYTPHPDSMARFTALDMEGKVEWAISAD